MGVILRQTLKTTSVIYVASIIGLINRLYLLPKYLSPSEIGFLDNFIYISTIVGSLSMLGSHSVIIKFSQKFKNKLKYDVLLAYVFIVSIIGYLFISLMFYTLKNNVLDFYSNDKVLIEKYYYYIYIISLFFVLRSYFTVYSIVEKRMAVPTLTNDMFAKGSTFILLILIATNIIQFDFYIFLLVVLYIFSVVILISYVLKYLNFSLSFKLAKIKKGDLFSMFKFSTFSLLSSLTGSIFLFSDSIMLSGLKDFKTAGIYSIAFFIGSSIEIPKRALSTFAAPFIASYFEKNKLKEINILYKQSSNNQGFIGFLFYLIVLINIDLIFLLLPNSYVYIIGINVTIIIGAAKVIDMIFGVNSEILRNSKYYYLDLLILGSLLVINILLNLYLIPIYKINGAAFATLISIILYNIFRFILLNKLYNFFPFSFKSIKIIIIFSLLFILNEMIPYYSVSTKMSIIILLVLKSFIFSIIFIMASFYFKVSDELNMLLRKIIKIK